MHVAFGCRGSRAYVGVRVEIEVEIEVEVGVEIKVEVKIEDLGKIFKGGVSLLEYLLFIVGD